jgi:hypothetical protein
MHSLKYNKKPFVSPLDYNNLIQVSHGKFKVASEARAIL